MIGRSIDRHVDTDQTIAEREALLDALSQLVRESEQRPAVTTTEGAQAEIAWQNARIIELRRERGL